MNKYTLIDSGNLKKLEKFGPYTIIRPCLQAVWRSKLKKDIWEQADFIFVRDSKNKWLDNSKSKKDLKNLSWTIDVDKIKLNLELTDFGHIGFFQEHVFLCKKLKALIENIKKEENISKEKPKINILNLFAYTGLATLFAAKSGANVCHVDSSKPTILWAKKNVKTNKLENAPIRWIQDDVLKFLKREVNRGSKYDGIVLDPPSFGRGAKGEVFKIETDILTLLDLSKQLLKKSKFSFIIFSTHSPGFNKTAIQNLFIDLFKKDDHLDIDELLINSEKSYALPSGYYAIWQKNEKIF
ncbi:MAG: Ribosomal RNA large subunit methyltransferase K/L [Candidatus Anoxychlamydiales bacterium]|nr:Ribosomal RNA large subunit methyltransferase K/L [Candidatus Anoxychlamydiales bacterium]